MSFKRLVLFFTFLAIFTMAFRVSVDRDTWWHLRAGAEIVEQQKILTEDPFSITRFQQPWRYPGWLAQLMLFGTYQALGFVGLNLITALMVVVAFVWVWQYIEGPILLRSALILLAAATSGVYWSARPQIMSFALTGLFIYVLERERKTKGASLWIYFIIMAFWANVHGGFAIAFILIAAYFGGDLLTLFGAVLTDPTQWRSSLKESNPIIQRWGKIIVISLIGLCINPHGPSMVLYPFKTVSIGALREYIQEWQSPDFHMLSILPFLGMLLLAFVSFGVSQKREHPTDYLLVLGLGFMSFWAARNISLFALGSVIPISRAISSFPRFEFPWTTSSKDLPKTLRLSINTFLAVILLIAAIAKISVPADNRFNQDHVTDSFPSGAIAYLKNNSYQGPIFNSYNWGAFLIWELYPKYRSFVDGRTDLFDDEILEQYLEAWRAEPGWQEVFSRWDIQLALIEPYSPLVAELRLNRWEIMYESTEAMIFARPTDF